jgi:hypothetical protein
MIIICKVGTDTTMFELTQGTLYLDNRVTRGVVGLRIVGVRWVCGYGVLSGSWDAFAGSAKRLSIGKGQTYLKRSAVSTLGACK